MIMSTIYKYPLEMGGHQTISGPFLRPLTVAVQAGIPCIWGSVDTEAEELTYRVRIYGTGHPIADIEMMDYLGTFMLHEETFVGHVFVEQI